MNKTYIYLAGPRNSWKEWNREFALWARENKLPFCGYIPNIFSRRITSFYGSKRFLRDLANSYIGYRIIIRSDDYPLWYLRWMGDCTQYFEHLENCYE